MDFPVLQKSGPEFSPVHWGGGDGRILRSYFMAVILVQNLRPFFTAQKNFWGTALRAAKT
jgi:hypothetical protein